MSAESIFGFAAFFVGNVACASLLGWAVNHGLTALRRDRPEEEPARD